MTSIDRKLGELDGKVDYLREDMESLKKGINKNFKQNSKMLVVMSDNQKAIERHLNDHTKKERRNLTLAGIFATIISIITNVIWRFKNA
jgi:hypothetical protein